MQRKDFDLSLSPKPVDYNRGWMMGYDEEITIEIVAGMRKHKTAIALGFKLAEFGGKTEDIRNMLLYKQTCLSKISSTAYKFWRQYSRHKYIEIIRDMLYRKGLPAEISFYIVNFLE